jgi:hypothetical protein
MPIVFAVAAAVVNSHAGFAELAAAPPPQLGHASLPCYDVTANWPLLAQAQPALLTASAVPLHPSSAAAVVYSHL